MTPYRKSHETDQGTRKNNQSIAKEWFTEKVGITSETIPIAGRIRI